VFERALDATLSRASARFTRFDGNLAHLDVVSPADPERVVSPTRLERWAECPHSYFMESVLRVDIPDRPEEVYEILPTDKGTLVHEALDRFLREVLTRDGGAPAAAERWTERDHERLREIGNQLCDEYEARGLTGRPAFWSRDRRRILADLDRFLGADDEERAVDGLVPLASEFAFGIRGEGTPVEVPLSDGRTLRFRGAADRVDRAGDGALVVTDYKTGKIDSYRQISEENPDLSGRRLQLPVYAHAVRREYGEQLTPVEAAYWFVSDRGGFKKIALPLTKTVATRIDVVLRAIVDGIERGVFPCRVDPPSTSPLRFRDYVDPDLRGTRDRYREWLRKREAPELAAYVTLAEGGDGAEGDS
jgi:ATP-dependent helicase/nuclease subunit B